MEATSLPSNSTSFARSNVFNAFADTSSSTSGSTLSSSSCSEASAASVTSSSFMSSAAPSSKTTSAVIASSDVSAISFDSISALFRFLFLVFSVLAAVNVDSTFCSCAAFGCGALALAS